MKKNENILKRVYSFEQKRGISYAKCDGKLFKTLKIFYTICFVYTLGINLLYITSVLMRFSGTDNLKDYSNSLYTVSIATFISVVGLVFLCTKLKIIGSAMSILPIPFLVLNFAKATEDVLGFMGYKPLFYYRHLIPLVIMLILSVFMFVIALRSEIKLTKNYNKVSENLFNMYNISVTNSDENAIVSDEMWNEFLENYNGEAYRPQFKEDK